MAKIGMDYNNNVNVRKDTMIKMGNLRIVLDVPQAARNVFPKIHVRNANQI